MISRLGVSEEQGDIRALKAYDVGDIIVARADHPCAGRNEIALEHLIQYPWNLPPPNNPFRSYLEAMFYQEGLPFPNNVFEIASIFAARDILLENGASCAPCHRRVCVRRYRTACSSSSMYRFR